MFVQPSPEHYLDQGMFRSTYLFEIKQVVGLDRFNLQRFQTLGLKLEFILHKVFVYSGFSFRKDSLYND